MRSKNTNTNTLASRKNADHEAHVATHDAERHSVTVANSTLLATKQAPDVSACTFAAFCAVFCVQMCRLTRISIDDERKDNQQCLTSEPNQSTDVVK